MADFALVGLMAFVAVVELSASAIVACLAFRFCRLLITQE